MWVHQIAHCTSLPQVMIIVFPAIQLTHTAQLCYTYRLRVNNVFAGMRSYCVGQTPDKLGSIMLKDGGS